MPGIFNVLYPDKILSSSTSGSPVTARPGPDSMTWNGSAPIQLYRPIWSPPTTLSRRNERDDPWDILRYATEGVKKYPGIVVNMGTMFGLRDASERIRSKTGNSG